MSLGVMLNPLNSSMIALALYSIQKDFGLPFATVSWLVTAFYLASMVGQPLMGRLGDMAGHKRLFMVGLAISFAAALGGALATSFAVVLLMRIGQSVGTSPLFPCANATVSRAYGARKGTWVAVMATVNSAMAALGPTIGGLAITFWSWQGIFVVNLPAIAIALFLCWRYYPKDPSPVRFNGAFLREMDLPGVLTFALTILALSAFILSWKGQVLWVLLAVGLIAGVAFILRERRTARPFIDLAVFPAHPMIGFTLGMNFLLNGFYYIIFFGLPLYLQTVAGLSPGKSGMVMFFCAGISMFVGPVVGRYSDRMGYAKVMAFGIAVLALSGLLFRTVFLGHGLAVMVLLMAFSGVAFGALNVTFQLALMDHTPHDYIGMTIGLMQSSRYLGAIAANIALAVAVKGTMTEAIFAHLLSLMLLSALLATALWALSRLHERRHAAAAD